MSLYDQIQSNGNFHTFLLFVPKQTNLKPKPSLSPILLESHPSTLPQKPFLLSPRPMLNSHAASRATLSPKPHVSVRGPSSPCFGLYCSSCSSSLISSISTSTVVALSVDDSTQKYARSHNRARNHSRSRHRNAQSIFALDCDSDCDSDRASAIAMALRTRCICNSSTSYRVCGGVHGLYSSHAVDRRHRSRNSHRASLLHWGSVASASGGHSPRTSGESRRVRICESFFVPRWSYRFRNTGNLHGLRCSGTCCQTRGSGAVLSPVEYARPRKERLEFSLQLVICWKSRRSGQLRDKMRFFPPFSTQGIYYLLHQGKKESF